MAVSHHIASNFKLIDMTESDHVYILKVRARNLENKMRAIGQLDSVPSSQPCS